MTRVNINIGIKTRVHCYDDCTSVISKKIGFVNKYISKDELRLSVIGTLPMLRNQLKCPSCSRLLRREWHEADPVRHKWIIKYKWNRYAGKNDIINQCSCGVIK